MRHILATHSDFELLVRAGYQRHHGRCARSCTFPACQPLHIDADGEQLTASQQKPHNNPATRALLSVLHCEMHSQLHKSTRQTLAQLWVLLIQALSKLIKQLVALPDDLQRTQLRVRSGSVPLVVAIMHL